MCLPYNSENLGTISGTTVIPVSTEGYIYWHIREDKITADMDKMRVIMAFENGFKLLEKQFYPIQFKSTNDISIAPIVMGFFNDNDPDLPQKFGNGVLAYAYGNYGSKFKFSSDIFFQDSYKWAEMHKPNEFNLTKVFVHECMHALGFGHSEIKEDILYWQYQSNDLIEFSEDTKKAILARYSAEMAKVPGTKPKENTEIEIIKKWCIDILNFKLNQKYFNSNILINFISYFGLKKANDRNTMLAILNKYFYG